MKFWRRLRWLATAAFVLVLLAAWLVAEPDATRTAGPAPRPAPVFDNQP